MTLTYEEQRLQNIRDNEALLRSLGLSTPGKPATPAPKKTPASTALRKTASTQARKRRLQETPQSDGTPSKVSKSSSEKKSGDSPSSSPGLRRSSRSSSRIVTYTEERESGLPASLTASPKASRGRAGSDDFEVDDDDGRMRLAQRLGQRIHDPKQFGHIPGVEVGRWWPSRMDASTDAIHAPTVAGISGNATDGAYSVALSGGYPDDVDLGDRFTYTGSGGRDLKGTKNAPKNLRTAPQTMHQTFDNPMNAALKRSAETKLPVRVIRGFKLQSPYAPETGYRYDGLYTVEKAWMAKGLTKGLMVCRYAFKRVSGQGELPVRSEGDEEAPEVGE